MRESTKRLRHRHYWRHRIENRVRIRLRSSIRLLTPTTSYTGDLPRMIIHEIGKPIQELEDGQPDIRLEIEEILPPTEKDLVWDMKDVQVVEKRSQFLQPVLDEAEYLLPEPPSHLSPLPSPFDFLSTYPGYPDGLADFQPGLVNQKSVEDISDPQPGPSNPQALQKKPKQLKTSQLPVPSRHSSGIFRKFVYTKLSEAETEQFFVNQRIEMTARTLQAKEIYEGFREQAVSNGNRYYKEWERREKQHQKEVRDQFKWDLAIQEYFVKLKEFDKGVIKIRPRPLILVNESVTALLRRKGDTPPDKIRLSNYSDDDPVSSPQDLPPFVHQENRDFLWKLRNEVGPTMVPGGYLYVYYDVREDGEVYRVQEFEYSKQFQSCSSSELLLLSSTEENGGGISPPNFSTPPVILPPPLPTINQILIDRGWSTSTINAYFLQKDTLEKIVPHLEEDTEEYYVEAEIWGKNNSFNASNFKKGEPRVVNPCKGYYERVDWFMFFEMVKRNRKWKILKDRGLAPTEANLATIDFRFKDVMDELFPKLTESVSEQLPFPRKVKVAVCQMHSTEDKESNLEIGIKLLKIAKDKNISMVFFPEAFDFIAATIEETVEMSETLGGPIITRYKELALQFDIWISLGGFHERLMDKKKNGEPWLSHSHIIINPQGNIVSIYRKMHLLDVNVPKQWLHLHESCYLKPGQATVVAAGTPIGKVGLGIGHDLRFPDFAMSYRNEGAEVLTYPSAITVHTGKAHWETLLKTRAIENQCFVIAAAQSGQHNGQRFSHGHSMIVDPWGTVLASTTHGSGLITAEIDFDHLERVRREMPVMSHKIPHLTGPFSIFSIPSTDVGERDFPFGPVRVQLKTVFLETLNSRAFVNKRCVAPGHVLVSCKRVVKRIKDLSAAEVADLFVLVQKVEEIMESVHGASSSTIAVQDGREAGQTIEHVHVHIIPRKTGDFKENDTVYQELATHDKGENIQWREIAEMMKECIGIRNHIRTYFQDILSSKTNSNSLPS